MTNMANKINLHITTQDIMRGVWNLVDILVTIIRSILIVGGALAASSADVVLGALTLDLLLVNTEGSVEWIKYAPALISLAASGVQLILWQLIQNEGGIRRAWRFSLGMKIAIVAVFLMKFGDDFLDITIVNYMMVGSVLPSVLGDLFVYLKWAVMFIVWVITGFSELFVVSAVELMKNARHKTNQEPPKQHHPQQRPNKHKSEQPKKTPAFFLDEQTRDELMKHMFKGEDKNA